MADGASTDAFTEFAAEAEPRLRRALCASLGPDVGIEATSEALAYAWDNWERVQGMDSPIGYLYRVGRTRVRPFWRWNRHNSALGFPAVAADRMPWVEPSLPGAVARLSERQRLTVVLVHAFDWTQAEVADLIGVSASTVQNHLERGMHRLRSAMGVPG
jgi:DNA-directed RNA polymerase specialized sigma24 family protein